jgi:MFS family permease
MNAEPLSGRGGARRILLARALRGFADGVASLLLASHLTWLGYDPFQVGVLVTATLLGSAALTLVVGLYGHRWQRRRILLSAAVLMLATGLGLFQLSAFWPLLVVAFVGTLNPSGGDVSVFLPVEQSALAETAEGAARTAIFARYNIVGSVCAALGALASGLPAALARWRGEDPAAAHRQGFLVYAAVALLIAALYRGLPSGEGGGARVATGLSAASRRRVLELSALFSLDSFAGGFAVQALVALWLFRRFALSVEIAGAVFFGAGLLAATSQLLAPRLAARIGLLRTMVFTHLPANCFLILAALMPNAALAVTCLLLRMSVAQMDVPARQSYVMAVVAPAERAAAASVTNVPRSLASALAPIFAGAMLDRTSFGWPLVCAGVMKIVYDLLLLWRFRSVVPPEEQAR